MNSERSRKIQGFFAFIGYLIFVIVLVAAGMELAAFAIWSAYHGLRPDRQEKLGASSPAYAGYPWAAEFWKEEQARRKVHHGRYVPFLVWGVAEWHGRYVNADVTNLGTLRRTINADSAACTEGKPLTTVWMFGGSTMFGSGVPDWATLPSYLSHDLNAGGGACFRVENLGAEGYNTNQEVILLEKQLKAGRHPDVVIFYDGVNDSYLGMFAPGFPEAHWDYAAIQARVEGSLAGKLEFLRNSYALRLMREVMLRRGAGSGGASEIDLARKAGAVLDNYEANLRIARVLGQAYGFQVHCFWQPSLAYGRKPLAPYEEQLVKLDANSPEGSAFLSMGAAYHEAARRAARDGSFVFLGDLFDSASEPLYLDRWMHVGPRGNEIQAAAVARYLEAHAPAGAR
jgi:hypothetical protein